MHRPAADPVRSSGFTPTDVRRAGHRARAPRWSSSPTSGSTSSRPPPRRPRTRSATCRIGIIGSLVICTVLYCRRRPGHHRHGPVRPDRPRGGAGHRVRDGRQTGYATLISAGAVAGLTTVVMTLMIGAARVLFAMCRDWLLPRALGTQPQAPAPRCGSPSTIGVAGRAHRGADPDRQARGDGQHRHAGRVHPRVHRGPGAAQAPPDLQALVHGAVQPGAADPGRGRLRLPDAQPLPARPGSGSSSGWRSASSSTSPTAATAGCPAARWC